MSQQLGTPLTQAHLKMLRSAALTYKRNNEGDLLRAPTRRKSNKTQDYEDNLKSLAVVNESLLTYLREALDHPAQPMPISAELLAHAALVVEDWMSDKTDTQAKNLTNRYSARELHNYYSAVHNAITDLQGAPPLFRRAPYPAR